MNLIPLPAFQDNYLLLHNGRRAPVGDPGDAQTVPQRLQRDGQQLEAILVTHHQTGATRVCRTNEYTLSKPKLARTAEPRNPKLINYIQRCEEWSSRGLPAPPSTRYPQG